MTTLLLTRGVPGSGKSTFAEAWVAEAPQWRTRVNRDDMRFSMYGEYVLDRMREDTVTIAQRAQVVALLTAGISVVVDDTNLRAQSVRDWQKVAADADAEVEFRDFEITLDEALRRNQHRSDNGGRFVPEAVIRSFFERYTRKGWLNPPPEVTTNRVVWEPYVVPEVFKPAAILVDIDGTLADMSGNGRSPYDYTRVGEDDLIHNVAEVVIRLFESGLRVIIMSGREDSCRQDTVNWLHKHEIFFHELHMRKTADMRKDNIVKYELFNSHVRDNYNVVGVFDDRKQVCYMWEAIGLTLFRVGPIDADF